MRATGGPARAEEKSRALSIAARLTRRAGRNKQMARHTGKFTWHELMAADKDRARAFYPEVFNWKVEEMNMASGPYSMLKVGDAPIGGLMTPPAEGIPPHWVGYISVENVDDTAARVATAGGKTLMDAIDVPGVGRIQPIADPAGATLCLFQAEDNDPDPVEGAGSIHWNELWSPDAATSVKFYEEVFGYGHSTMEMPDGTYFILEADGAPVGGVLTAPKEMKAPPMWLQFVTVDDADAAANRVKQGGGELLKEPMDVPGIGRFAMMKDPLGAVIGFIEPAPKN
jgi:predicted enzyme related to lactoylglutathione lyase